MSSPRRLRNTLDSICLVFAVALGAVSTAATCVAGSEERIMSDYFGQLICGMTFGWAATAFFISSLAVTNAKPQSRYTSLRSTTIARGVLFVAGCAFAGYESTIFKGYELCDAYRGRYSGRYSGPNGGGSAANCQLPLASGILAWFLVGAIAFCALFEIGSITGGAADSRSTWGASLLELPNVQGLPEEEKGSLNV